MSDARIIIGTNINLIKSDSWDYPLTEIEYLLYQIKDGDRENEEVFILCGDRLYETSREEKQMADQKIKLISECEDINITGMIDMLMSIRNDYGNMTIAVSGMNRFYAHKQGDTLILDSTQLAEEE